MVDPFEYTVMSIQHWGNRGHLSSFEPPCPHLPRHVYKQKLASLTELTYKSAERGSIHPTGVSKQVLVKDLKDKVHSPNSPWRVFIPKEQQ